MSVHRPSLREAFRRRFGREPRLFRAPGRIEFIGNHTDYNEGFVFPVAIDREVMLAAAPREDDTVRLYSMQFHQESVFSLRNLGRDEAAPWSHYVRGVAWALQEAGYELCGLDALISGDVPIGGGLSSSAAIEVAAAVTWEGLSGFALEPTQRARLCQRAENEFVGVQCGIMDQFIACLGRKGHGLLLDCRTLEYEVVPLPLEGYALVVLDTGKPRELAASAYNERRATCEAAVAYFRRWKPAARALRDITLEDLERFGDGLGETARKRVRHVLEENQRVLAFAEAAKAGDVAELGRLMVASHASSRDLYEVSCFELDTMVELALSVEGVVGARMSGAGFGGAVIALAREEAIPALQAFLLREYPARTGLIPQVFVCHPDDGAGEVERRGGKRPAKAKDSVGRRSPSPKKGGTP